MDELRTPVTHLRPWQTKRGVRILGGTSLALALAGLAALVAFVALGGSRRPLAHTVASPEALGEAVLSAFRDGDVASLRAMALTEGEFRAHVWPELPISQPERNVPFEFAWDMLHQHSDGYLRQLAAEFEGSDFTLTRVEFGGATTAYRDVTVHRDTRLVVQGGDGKERTIRLFGSTIEQNGQYKVFSFVADD